MTLRAYLRVLRERWRLVAVVTVTALALSVLITAASSKIYQATTQIYVASNTTPDPTAQYQAIASIQAEVATFATIVDSPNVLKAVRTDLGLTITDQQLKSHLTATAPLTKTLVLLHATDPSPAQAAALANSAANAFIQAVESYSTPSGSTVSSVHLFVTDPAVAPSKPISPNPTVNIALGLVLGLLLGLALAVARDVLDTRIKDPDAMAAAAGSTTMGVVVEDPKTARHVVAARAGARNQRAENFRQLRANLQFANVDEHPRVIAVTSSIPTEGKTTIAINLASTLAEAGFTVCLVDADLRRPTVARVLGMVAPVGLTSVLIHQIELDEAIQSAGAGFYVLTSGPTPPNPSEVLASTSVGKVIRSLLDKVDYVVIDTAPLLPVADGSEVAALADGTLLVGRYGFTTDAQVRRAGQMLHRVDAKLIGIVLNRLPVRRRDEYGYSYYRSEADGPGHAKREVAKASGKRGLSRKS